MARLSNQYNGLFHNDEITYNEQLDKCAKSLRNSAQNIVEYIDKLANKTESLINLKKSYSKLESMPVQKLCFGIEDVKSKLLKVEFLSKSKSASRKEQDEFVSFFELQNEFNAEVNAFVKKVIQLEVIN